MRICLTMLLLSLGFIQAALSQSIDYKLIIDQPHRSYFTVEVTYQTEGESFVDFVMPAWVPGYYSIQNPARNVVRVAAVNSQGQKLPFEKTDKETWRVNTKDQKSVTLSYQVYAYSLGTPYYAHMDADFAYFNGAYIFMYIAGKKNMPVQVKFAYPEGWKFHTALQTKLAENVYQAPDYDAFIDAPAFFGKLERFSFDVDGIPHHVVLNAGYSYNADRIRQDLTRLVKWYKSIFGELPYQSYTFFVRVANPGHGGMEHWNSNVACVTPDALSGNLEDPAYYGDFLMLECHEYFHLFNVKRIHPKGIGPFDYTKETYTKMLWVAEGFTSYYTHRPLVKAGIIPEENILGNWAGYYNQMMQNATLDLKSVAMFSYDSWIAQSDIPDYTFRIFYLKGAFIAMLLDIDMRLRSGQQKTMDGFFRYLYDNVYKKGLSYDLNSFLKLLNSYSGYDYSDFFGKYVTGTDSLPLGAYLAKTGLELIPVDTLPYLGIQLASNTGDAATVYVVMPGSPADSLKIGRGSQIQYLNDREVTPANWEEIVRTIKPGTSVNITWQQNGTIRNDQILAKREKTHSYKIIMNPNLTAEQRAFQKAWLQP